MEHRLVEDRSKPPHTLLDSRWRDAGEAKAQFVRPGAVGIEVVTGHERDAGDSGRLREAVGIDICGQATPEVETARGRAASQGARRQDSPKSGEHRLVA